MIDVRGDERLRATVLVMKNLERPVVREINNRTRTTLNPLWKGLVSTHASYAADTAVLAKGVRIRAGNPPAAIAASSRRKLRGGLIPADQYAVREFGGNRDHVRKYTRRSKRGGTHQVTRHTARQLPPRYRKGRVVFPAFAEFAPRAVSLWVQTVVRTVMEGIEKAAG